MRQRVSEIGVRRAFGSTRTEMMGQIVMENLIVTLFAGLVGLLFSVLFAYLGNSLLFAQAYSTTLNPPEVNASILLQPSTFMYALLFCFGITVSFISTDFYMMCICFQAFKISLQFLILFLLNTFSVTTAGNKRGLLQSCFFFVDFQQFTNIINGILFPLLKLYTEIA